MKAYNIDWSVDVEEAINTLDAMPAKDVAKVMGISLSKVLFQNKALLHEVYREKFKRMPILLDRVEHLPAEVELPEGFENEPDDVITEYLSNEYGYCINGYSLDRDEKQAEEIER